MGKNLLIQLELKESSAFSGTLQVFQALCHLHLNAEVPFASVLPQG